MPPDPLNVLPYLTGFGDKSFLELIKKGLGMRAKGRRIYESEDEYQLRERQASYRGWHDSDNETTFDWNLSN